MPALEAVLTRKHSPKFLYNNGSSKVMLTSSEIVSLNLLQGEDRGRHLAGGHFVEAEGASQQLTMAASVTLLSTEGPIRSGVLTLWRSSCSAFEALSEGFLADRST